MHLSLVIGSKFSKWQVCRHIFNFSNRLIFIRVTVNGARIEFRTKRFTTSEKWSVEGNPMKGSGTDSKATNSYLDTLKARIYYY